MQGKYLRQWKTANDQATIQGLAAGRDGMSVRIHCRIDLCL